MREWRNWQTHHLEGVAPHRRVGSSPTSRTKQISLLFYIHFLEIYRKKRIEVPVSRKNIFTMINCK